MGLLERRKNSDPTWQNAHILVKKHLPLPNHIFRLFRSGWMGDIQTIDYVKILGFSLLDPACLIRAAEFEAGKIESGRGAVEKAIGYLGIRYSAVVLAVNLFTKLLLQQKPPPGWKAYLSKMMTEIEIGYRFGSKASDLGSEAGALLAFLRNTGLGLFLAFEQDAFKKYQTGMRSGELTPQRLELKNFNCEIYQASAFITQQFGFSPELAVGIALGSGRIDPTFVEIDENLVRWQAACDWIDALRDGKSFPSNVERRNFFRELAPKQGKERNLNLEVLHTEISKLQNVGSTWTWHLPRPTYEETARHFGL